MKNIYLIITTLLLALAPSVAQAHDGNHAQCYPLVNGEEGMGSTNSIQLPHTHTSGSWTSYIYVTNTGYKKVNVKLNYTRFDSSVYAPVNVQYHGAFNSANSPLDLLNGGGILRPHETARITIRDDNYSEDLSGSISWQADACIESALVVSVRNQYSVSGRIATSLQVLNGGKAF